MPHEPLPPPEPIQGRRTATEPTAEDPARAAAHTSRRHAPSPRSRRDPHVHPRHDRTTPLPHECLTSRPSQSTGDAPRRSQHRRSGARRRPFRPPPRTVTAPPTRPPRPPTPRQDHARFRAHGGAPRARAPDEPPPHARPSDRRADAPVHSAAPVAAPRPCSAPVCRRSAEALGTPVSQATGVL